MHPQTEHSHGKTILAAITAFLIAGATGASIALGVVKVPGLQSILPGFQGMQDGIWGYQVQGGGGATTIGSGLPSQQCWNYNWLGAPTIASATIQASSRFGLTCPISVSDSLVVDAQTNPISQNSPFVAGQKVSYYVKNPTNPSQYMIVLGQVNVYTYNVDFSIQSGSSGYHNFAGDTVWYNLYSQTWNQATSCPCNSSLNGNAFETPLYAVVTNVQWQNQGTNGISAAVNGAPIPLYGSPSTSGQTLATLAGQTFSPGSTNVNSTLSSIYAPDSRLTRLAYYPISLLNFQANGIAAGCSFGCSYPSATLTITLYSLQIGEYILTNPSQTTLNNRNQNCTGLGCIIQYLSSFAYWLTNPLNQLLVGLLGLLGGGILVVVILAVFATPVVVTALYIYSRRKQGGQG